MGLSEKARTDFVPALPGSLAGSCLGLLEGGPSNCGREEGEAMEAREAKEAIVEAGTTTYNQKLQQEGKVYFGGNCGVPEKCQHGNGRCGQDRNTSGPNQPQTTPYSQSFLSKIS